ncbi:hypothetical protein BJ875DRAFT_494902 [Amylocarpus encephaloides]|uniref:Uncharacterized protein n=1 Tax=Amylocarpus encephaloides TaxID=45428 RepID=A0A9P7YM13_9HELO|nr:hypothetical protein BJ875DRAFT_494902 [Amylocarpus encephaloides]
MVERKRSGFQEVMVEEQEEEDVKQYSYYNETLAKNSYATGDVYDPEPTGNGLQEWENPDGVPPAPYLAHVKSLSLIWRSLRLLADFMEVGTHPERWDGLLLGNPASKESRKKEVKRRARRTKVTRLDYLSSGVKCDDEYGTPDQLKTGLNDEKIREPGSFRLFVVEDLSRDMIELLGEHLDIEPAFFREQIFDYTWYNPRDRWVDAPRLSAVIRNQRWLRMRFPLIRYYKTSQDFMRASKEFEEFNVLRRPEDDTNNNSIWDKEEAKVGIARSRASFWYSGESKVGNAKGPIGVLLVDPTPTSGQPLWLGYRNWEEAPSMHGLKSVLKGPPRDSIYKDMIYWAQRTNAFKQSQTAPKSNTHLPIQALTHMVAAQWIEASEYVRTRLGQIEWEVSFPEHFVKTDRKINDTLKKLHIWRRLVPIYREMLTETLERAFQFSCHHPVQAITETSSTPHSPIANADTHGTGGIPQGNQTSPTALNTALAAQNSSPSSNASTSVDSSCHCKCWTPKPKESPIDAMKDDFERSLRYMEEYQQRIDRLTSVVTAIISIDDSHVSQEDNKNVARLTWLATFFIPLGFIASLFSMTSDVSSMKETIKWYFAAAIPLAVLSLGVARISTLPSVKTFQTKQGKRVRKFSKRISKTFSSKKK